MTEGNPAGPDVYPLDAPGAYSGILIRRSLAFIADISIVVGLFLVGGLLLLILGTLTLGILWPNFDILMFVLFFAYFTATLGGRYSATPGMRWQEIEMRTWEGRRPGYIQVFLQTLAFYVSLVATPLVLLVPLFNKRRRCLHDFICGTVMVRTRSADTARPLN